MYLHRIINEVSSFLAGKGIETRVVTRDVIGSEGVRVARQQFNCALPQSILEVYTSYSNGFMFEWPVGDESHDYSEVNGRLDFADLDSAIQWRSEWDDYFSHLVNVDIPRSRIRDKHAARLVAEGIRNWFPVIEEDNGDQFVVDALSGEVKYHIHDWLDSDVAGTGLVIASSLQEFLEAWSRVCFASPSYWPEVITEHGVEWTEGNFGVIRVL